MDFPSKCKCCNLGFRETTEYSLKDWVSKKSLDETWKHQGGSSDESSAFLVWNSYWHSSREKRETVTGNARRRRMWPGTCFGRPPCGTSGAHKTKWCIIGRLSTLWRSACWLGGIRFTRGWLVTIASWPRLTPARMSGVVLFTISLLLYGVKTNFFAWETLRILSGSLRHSSPPVSLSMNGILVDCFTLFFPLRNWFQVLSKKRKRKDTCIDICIHCLLVFSFLFNTNGASSTFQGTSSWWFNHSTYPMHLRWFLKRGSG